MGWTRRIPFIGSFRDRDSFTRSNVSTALLLAIASFTVYTFLLHPTYGGSPLSFTGAGSSFYYVHGDEAKYAVVAVRDIGGRTPTDASRLPHTSTSDTHPDQDVASDTAWVVAMGHWGCPVEFEVSEYLLPSGGIIPVASLEGKELAAPPVAKGLSAGVSFSLAQASIASGFNPDVAVAATGVVDSFGYIRKIGGIEYKVEAALASGAEVFYVPEGNFAQAERFAPDELRVVPVSHVSEVFADLGFPGHIDCAEAELR